MTEKEVVADLPQIGVQPRPGRQTALSDIKWVDLGAKRGIWILLLKYV